MFIDVAPEFEIGSYRYTITNSGNRQSKFRVKIERYEGVVYFSDRTYYHWVHVQQKEGLRSRRKADAWAKKRIEDWTKPAIEPKPKRKNKWFKVEPNKESETIYV